VATVEEALRNSRIKEFVKSTWEASKVLSVRRGGNRIGRFLKVVEQVVGGRRRFILLPEGCEGRGWSHV
jgi:hypothetical protein